MTQRDGRGQQCRSTASNQIELSGYSTWLRRSYHADRHPTAIFVACHGASSCLEHMAAP